MLREMFSDGRGGASVLSIGNIRKASLISPFARRFAVQVINSGRRVLIRSARLHNFPGTISIEGSGYSDGSANINAPNYSLGAQAYRGAAGQCKVTVKGDMRSESQFLSSSGVFVSSMFNVRTYLPVVGIRGQKCTILRESFLQPYNKSSVIRDSAGLWAEVVLAPSAICSHVLSGAYSVVNIDFPSWIIAAGGALRIIKKRPGFEGLADA